MRLYVEPCCLGVEPQPHPRRLQVGAAAVGEILPVGHLARDVIRDAAYGKVRVGVGHDHGHVDAGVELPSAQRGRDAGVTAPDDDQVHVGSSASCRLSGRDVSGTDGRGLSRAHGVRLVAAVGRRVGDDDFGRLLPG